MKKFTDSFWNKLGMNSNAETFEDRQLTLHGKQEELTRGENGKFQHPFLSQPSHVSTISYPDSKTISFKLSGRQPEQLKSSPIVGANINDYT